LRNAHQDSGETLRRFAALRNAHQDKECSNAHQDSRQIGQNYRSSQ
ncbi:MAG: hypothetical protein HC800_20305, partial [Phormidesmis sp. RL_2_1]|nr:hypothetical protein [Phormidesmis sp. RL_2_1]